MKNGPIGIFDSGLGGLTVQREIARLLPGEDSVYLGDTAHVPYGTKSRETVTRYSLDNTDFLVKQGVKLIVAACNTASVYALEELSHNVDVPVVGVIEPGARAAAAHSRNKRVGVIGTEGTVKSGAYTDAIKGADPSIEVFSRPCPIFVPLAEEGWTGNEMARLTAKEYLTELHDDEIDTLVLGCTHYPLLKDTISGVMGEGVELIDSAMATAAEVKRLLTESSMLNHKSTALGVHKFFVTDSPVRFVRVGKNFLGENLIEAKLITIGS